MNSAVLGFDLFLAAEDMTVILGEAAHAHDAMQRAGRFIAITTAEFGHPQGKVAIGFETLVENLHMAGAVHWLQRVDRLFAGVILVNLDDEHVLLVFFPVARRFPQACDHTTCGVLTST